MFTLYLSKYRGNETNTFYLHEARIRTKQDLEAAVKLDHIFSKMRNGHRATEDFLQCDCIAFDVDNSHSEDPDTWKTAGDIADAFPVNYIMVRSRNYMKPKRKRDKKTGEIIVYEPREKWHIYMPLSRPITDPAGHATLMKHIQALFPLIDARAKDCAHFFYGVSDPHIEIYNNGVCIDAYIENNPAEVRAAEEESARDYVDNVQRGIYTDDKAEKVAADICDFLQIENPLSPGIQAAQLQGDPAETDNAPEWMKYINQTKSIQWVEQWAAKNNFPLGRRYVTSTAKYPHTVFICVECPWSDEHSAAGSDTETVIYIDQDGTIKFYCHHDHCYGREWADFRAKVEADTRARAQTAQAPAEGAQRGTEGPAEDPAGNTAEKQETPAKDDLTAFLEKIQTEAYKPYKTELPFFDDLLGGGLTRQTVTLLMAAPGAGKTSLFAQIAEAMAAHGKPVIYLNLEMSREQMLAKAISGRLARKKGIKVTALQILQGYNWTEEQRQAIPAEIEQYRKQIFPYLRYNPADIGSDLERIQEYLTSIGEAAKAAGKPGPAVFLDYLHLVNAPQYDTAALIKATVTMLKEYALHYDTVALGIVAANRDSTKNGRYTLESGRDSSNLEYTADCQLSLNYYDIDKGNIKPSNINGIAWLQRETWRLMIIRVLKGRFVTPGKSAKVYFNAAYNSFYGAREYMPADPTRRPFNKKPELPEEWQSVDAEGEEGAADGSDQGQQVTRL